MIKMIDDNSRNPFAIKEAHNKLRLANLALFANFEMPFDLSNLMHVTLSELRKLLNESDHKYLIARNILNIFDQVENHE